MLLSLSVSAPSLVRPMTATSFAPSGANAVSAIVVPPAVSVWGETIWAPASSSTFTVAPAPPGMSASIVRSPQESRYSPTGGPIDGVTA